MVRRRAAGNDDSATDGDLTSTERRFQTVAHWIRGKVDGGPAVGRREPAITAYRSCYLRAARLGQRMLGEIGRHASRACAELTAFRTGYVPNSNEIISASQRHFTTTLLGGLGAVAVAICALPRLAPISVPSVPAFLYGLSTASV